jgi:hypothetical protein
VVEPCLACDQDFPGYPPSCFAHLLIISPLKDWSLYGIDFSGPISSSHDDHTGVVVDEVPSVLSGEELQLLQGRFIQPSTLEEDSMLRNFIVAKSFVQDSYYHH